MEEVTDRIAAGETPEALIRVAEAEGKGYKASVEQMYYGNQQFLFVYEQFDDVRLVGAPPSSIGKFGGDTDHWIWPARTTGRPPMPPTMCPIVRNDISHSPRKEFARAISR